MNIKIDYIMMDVPAGTTLRGASENAVELATHQKVDVKFNFNGHNYEIKYIDLLKCVKEISRETT